MADIDSKQFDGTFGGAKAVCAWVGDATKAVYGPGFAEHDTDDGGLNLVTEGKDAAGADHLIYETVDKGDWVVRGANGLAVFTDAQYQFAYGAK
jgi:hypothetical protein